MPDNFAQITLDMMLSRLRNLRAFMAKAEAHAADQNTDLANYVSTRIALDMHALPHQIVFACNQPSQFIAWLRGEPTPPNMPEPMPQDWRALTAHLEACIADLEKAQGEALAVPAEDKRIDIAMIKMHMMLPARRFVDDWLLPNFYFHLTTAYALLRMQGVPLGKGDFLAHVMPELRPND